MYIEGVSPLPSNQKTLIDWSVLILVTKLAPPKKSGYHPQTRSKLSGRVGHRKNWPSERDIKQKELDAAVWLAIEGNLQGSWLMGEAFTIAFSKL